MAHYRRFLLAFVAEPGPARMEDIKGKVAIVGVGESEHSAASGRALDDMIFAAIDASLDDAGLAPHQIDGLMFSGQSVGQMTVERFRAHYGLSYEIWESGAGGAYSFAATAPHAAHAAIASGKASVIVNVHGTDWASQNAADAGGPATAHLAEEIKANAEVPFGFIPQPVYFAHVARRHFELYGTKAEQLGAIAVSSRRHANGHPGAVMRHKTLSLDQYLAREPFIDPLRIEDCCLISDGACAYVMTASDRAKDFARTPVIVEGVGYAGAIEGIHFAMEPEFASTPHRMSAPGAFAMAGISPADVDVLAVYDPFTIVALMAIEDLGFCPKGEAGRFVEGDRLAFDRGRAKGGLPFNTHGGMLSHSYLLGINHVVELVRQLRGEAANQVADAQIAVYGGFSGVDAGTLVLRRG
jgi:acetyl-CoA acetyltransferase